MIEVILYRNDKEASRATAPVENAIYAANTLLDDQARDTMTWQGWRKHIRIVFLNDSTGECIRMIEGGRHINP